MIIKTLFGTVFFVIVLVWGFFVAVEQDPCTQVKKAAAPVRLVMQGARAIDRNLQFVTDPLTWLSWSISVDAMSQAGIARLLHGPELKCDAF